MVLKIIPKLDGTNYSLWRPQMESLLIKEGLWSYVTGTEPSESALEACLLSWKMCDRAARLTIIHFLEHGQHPLVSGCKTAAAVWQKLKHLYGNLELSSKVKTWKRICELRYCDGEDIKQHIAEMENLFEKLLLMAEPELSEQLCVVLLLQSLPDSFALLIKELSMLEGEDLSLELVKTRVIQEKALIQSRSLLAWK